MEWALAVVGLIAILMVAAVVVGGVFAARYYRLEERKWRNWIGARGWRAHRKWPQVLQHYTAGNLGKGMSERATKGYEGVFDGQAVAGFTYTYSTGTGPGEGKTFTHVCLLRIPGAQFPDLSVSYDGWLNRIDRDDIQFEDAEFNKQWLVSSRTPRFAHDVLHPRLMQRLKSDDVPAFWTLWFERDAILICTNDLEPELVDHYLRFLSGVAASLPRHVLDDVGCVQHPVITNEGPRAIMEEQQRLGR